MQCCVFLNSKNNCYLLLLAFLISILNLFISSCTENDIRSNIVLFSEIRNNKIYLNKLINHNKAVYDSLMDAYANGIIDLNNDSIAYLTYATPGTHYENYLVLRSEDDKVNDSLLVTGNDNLYGTAGEGILYAVKMTDLLIEIYISQDNSLNKYSVIKFNHHFSTHINGIAISPKIKTAVGNMSLFIPKKRLFETRNFIIDIKNARLDFIDFGVFCIDLPAIFDEDSSFYFISSRGCSYEYNYFDYKVISPEYSNNLTEYLTANKGASNLLLKYNIGGELNMISEVDGDLKDIINNRYFIILEKANDSDKEILTYYDGKEEFKRNEIDSGYIFMDIKYDKTSNSVYYTKFKSKAAEESAIYSYCLNDKKITLNYASKNPLYLLK